jgi:hypothetical protein
MPTGRPDKLSNIELDLLDDLKWLLVAAATWDMGKAATAGRFQQVEPPKTAASAGKRQTSFSHSCMSSMQALQRP